MPGMLQELLAEGQPEDAHDGRPQNHPGRRQLQRGRRPIVLRRRRAAAVSVEPRS